MENLSGNIKLKRLLAFAFDIAFIVLLAFTVYMVTGIIFKIDSVGFQNITFPILLILITGYLFFGEIFFKNTFGKYLTGIEVSGSETPGRPSIQCFVKRGVLKIFFPVEGLVLLFSKNNTRLGDIWANTAVVNKESVRMNASARTVLGFAVLVALVLVFRISMGVAVRKADFYNAGIGYLTSTGEVKVTGMVKVVEQTRNSVNFIVPISNSTNNRYAIIYLKKNGSEWSVDRASFIQEHITGFSYGYDFSSSE